MNDSRKDSEDPEDGFQRDKGRSQIECQVGEFYIDPKCCDFR